MARRGLKPWIAVALPLIAAGAVIAVGAVSRNKQEAEFESYEATMPQVQLAKVMEQISAGDYDAMFEASQKLSPSLDSRETYVEAVKEILGNRDLSSITTETVSESDTERVYRLIDGDTLLGTLTLLNENGEWVPAFPLQGNKSYKVEVPSGLSLNVYGTPIGEEYLVSRGEEAANFFQVTDPSVIPYVDIYEFSGLLGEPALNSDEGYAMIQDVLSGDWLLGKEVKDEALLKELVQAAEYIAMYPAQDTPLSNVTAVSDTSSRWYQKYVTLQNYWFTAHNTMEITNESIKAVQQSDDTIVAHIAFDYYADNGEVHRTWHCGYQLTFRSLNGKYVVCGTEISSLLNPGQKY